MIGICIAGTKGGFLELYRSDNLIRSIAADIRNDSGSGFSIGQEAFSLSFIYSGVVFSKCRILTDGMAGQRVGNINISLFIPCDKKLAGKDVKALLDELLMIYCDKYAQGNTLENIHEDWTFINKSVDKYELNSTESIQYYEQGKGRAAYIYYSDDISLQKYFDEPFQEEYKEFKRIFFIEKRWIDRLENPLFALQYEPNADLTKIVNLEYYRLLYKQLTNNGVKVYVTINGKGISNNSKIYKEDILGIYWSKQFYNSQETHDKWYKIDSKFLFVNHTAQTITVKEVDLEQTTYTFKFEVKNRFDIKIDDAKIILINKGNLIERNVKDKEVKLTEEELQNRWTVVAKKRDFIPEEKEILKEDDGKTIDLILKEIKKIKFEVKGDKRLLYDYKIHINNVEIDDKQGTIDFIGEDIDKTFTISVSHRDYVTSTFRYCPNEGDNIKEVDLQNKDNLNDRSDYPREKYILKVDKKEGIQSWPENEIRVWDGKPPFKIEPHFGYKFVDWEINENERICQAVFEKLWYYKIGMWVLILIVVVSIAIASIYIYKKISDSTGSMKLEQIEGINNKIDSYVNGIELNLDTLKELSSHYCNSTNNISNISKKGRLQKILQLLFGNDDEKLTNEFQNQFDFCDKIENAIILRKDINFGRIRELKNKNYSDFQQNFMHSIDSIEDKYQNQIGDKLKNIGVSLMDLNEIAALIRKVHNDIKSTETTNKSSHETESKNAKPKEEQSNQIDNRESEIKLIKIPSKNQKSSLKDEFWSLVHELGPVSMDCYRSLYNKYRRINNKNKEEKEILDFLHEITFNSDKFKEFARINEEVRINANKLNELQNK